VPKEGDEKGVPKEETAGERKKEDVAKDAEDKGVPKNEETRWVLPEGGEADGDAVPPRVPSPPPSETPGDIKRWNTS
jgi:hypothetical protein